MLERLMVLVPPSNFPLRTSGLRHWVLTAALAWAGWTRTPGAHAAAPFTLTIPAPTASQPHTPAPIAWNELGTKATAQYAGGDALAITPTAAGSLTLRCEFQKLAGEVTPGGLWLTSTITNASVKRFSVVAAAVGRQSGTVAPLPAQGNVTGDTNVARFIRPGLTEEYSVSVDGVRQDFVIASAPAGTGELRVELAVQGARAQTAANGARLVLAGSGRTLAYSHLRVMDATGRELAARLEVPAPGRLAVRVNDAAAVYPVRIDPTFSDANWVTLGSGMNGPVLAMAFVGSTLYVGGEFTTAGGISANNIARWNGTNWSALGSGVVLSGGGAEVFCLAVSGSTLYVGGAFDTAGGISASCVASWNGTNWSALGSGVPATYALAVYGTNLYAGGEYESSARIGGVVGSAGIAYWNGTKWTGIVGMSAQSTYGTIINIYTLAVYRGLLYVGGTFVESGVGAAGFVAWNGTNYQSVAGWTPTVHSTAEVRNLLAANDKLYAEGVFAFKNPDGSTNVQLASFDGTNWLGVGNIQDFGALAGATTARLIDAMTFSGGNLYVGGIFTSIITSTITIPANNIACWNGSSWSVVGSGVTGIANPSVVFTK